MPTFSEKIDTKRLATAAADRATAAADAGGPGAPVLALVYATIVAVVAEAATDRATDELASVDAAEADALSAIDKMVDNDQARTAVARQFADLAQRRASAVLRASS